jgi:hypothetical protein
MWGVDGQMEGPWNDWPVYLHVDGESGCVEQIRNIALRSKHMADRTAIRIEGKNQGVNLNTYGTMQWLFREEGCDYAVYLEDDLVLSPDGLRLAAWYVEHAEEIGKIWSVDHIGAYCLCRTGGSAMHPSMLQLSRAFLGWGFVMSREQWEWVEPWWLRGESDEPPSMWDNHVANRIRRRSASTYNVLPVLSRITNIGREGEHHSPETWEADVGGMVIATQAAEYEFGIEGWDEETRAYRWDKLGLGDSWLAGVGIERPEHPPSLEK